MSETAQGSAIVALGARVHLFVRPHARQAFTSLFRDVLACKVSELDFGLAHPIQLVSFANGSAFSVEATELAPTVSDGYSLDDERAFRGAWIEFRTNDVDGLPAQASRGRHCRVPACR